MRAALVEQYGRPPVIGELAEPQRGQGQVLVELIAAPLNPVDLRIASGSFSRGSPPLPYVPGVEGVGRVVEGDRLALGERVYFGGGGALAERVAIAQDATVSLPEGLEEALAASLGVAGLAAWLALEWRAKLAPGENVLVLGASGAVGQIAVQAARVLKAGRVVAAGRNPAALERALELGADATVALSGDREAFARSLREAAGGDGYDVVVDPLWGDPAAAALDAVKAYGRLVQVGESAGAEATLTSDRIRNTPLAILGHTNFAVPQDVRAAALEAIFEHAAAGRLTIDYELLPLERIGEAWERQASSPNRKLLLQP